MLNRSGEMEQKTQLGSVDGSAAEGEGGSRSGAELLLLRLKQLLNSEVILGGVDLSLYLLELPLGPGELP